MIVTLELLGITALKKNYGGWGGSTNDKSFDMTNVITGKQEKATKF